MSEFAVQLVECRRKSTLSQSELARKAGVSPSLVNKLETGGREPSSRKLVLALAKAMGLGKDATDALLVSADYAPEYPITVVHPIQRLMDDFVHDKRTTEYDIAIVRSLIEQLRQRPTSAESTDLPATPPTESDAHGPRRS